MGLTGCFAASGVDEGCESLCCCCEEEEDDDDDDDDEDDPLSFSQRGSCERCALCPWIASPASFSFSASCDVGRIDGLVDGRCEGALGLFCGCAVDCCGCVDGALLEGGKRGARFDDGPPTFFSFAASSAARRRRRKG